MKKFIFTDPEQGILSTCLFLGLQRVQKKIEEAVERGDKSSMSYFITERGVLLKLLKDCQEKGGQVVEVQKEEVKPTYKKEEVK